MRNTMIYPFSDKSVPLVLYFSKFQPEYEITTLVSPPGLGLAGHSPFYAVNRDGDSSLVVQSDVETAMQQCDALIVPFGDHKNDPVFCDALDVVRCAAEMGKEIFCCLKLTNLQRKEFKDICRMHDADWHDAFLEPTDVFKHVSFGDYQFGVPIVFVHNLGIDADSFEVTLSLAHRFIRDGYKVSVIGPNPEYNVIGFHGSSLLLSMIYGNVFLRNIPRFIKILEFYVHMIEVKENPDIILFHCPGATMPMKGLMRNDSGVYMYLISRAIRPDFSLVCMPYNSASTETINAIHSELTYQFGYGIDALHISNRTLHVETTKYYGEEQHIYFSERAAVGKAYEMRSKNQDGVPIFSALNTAEQELLYNQLLSHLIHQEEK